MTAEPKSSREPLGVWDGSAGVAAHIDAKAGDAPDLGQQQSILLSAGSV